jgi:DNA repair protein RadC
MAGGFEDAADKPHFLGHRERLRTRFMTAGPDALLDYELLELVLFRALSRQDTKPLAKQLIGKFGSFAEVIGAAPERLKEIKGVGDAIVTEIKLIEAASLRSLRAGVINRPVLQSWTQLIDYCHASMA